MNKILLIILLAFSGYFNLYAGGNKIKTLIIDGYSNHDWEYNTEVLKSMLINSGICDVDISTAPENHDPEYNKWRPKFDGYDVIVQNSNSLGNNNYWPVRVQRDFEEYIKDGGGMYVHHSANNAFSEWEEYNKMIGLGWRGVDDGFAIEIVNGKLKKIPPGEGEKTHHGPRVDIVVEKFTQHPINREMPKYWKTPDAELYKYARGPAENLTILSVTTDSATGKSWPVDWIVSYGKGRIYNSTFGHIWHNDRMPSSIQCVGYQTTFLRAIQWCAGKEVAYEVPENFPEKDQISLNPIEIIHDEENGWEKLFNGNNLDGWQVKSHSQDKNKEFWKAVNGAIECNSLGSSDHNYVWLLTKQEYSNFQLRMKFQIYRDYKGNSGVQFRSRYDENDEKSNGGWLNGPQVDIHPPTPLRTGLIYDETRDVQRWIYPDLEDHRIIMEKVPDAAKRTQLVYANDDPDAWNILELICDGMHIETFINHKKVTDFNAEGILNDKTHLSRNVGETGHIAMQLHSKSELIIRFKDVYLRER